MKRSTITLEAIVSLSNLALATHKAAKAKRSRPDVQAFLENLDSNLSKLSQDVLQGAAPYGKFKQFTIYDPKPRIIHAACFEDRIVHHALMNYTSPVLDRAMTSRSYACRVGFGVHKAAKQVLHMVRHYAWFLKLDIASYFAAISHDTLLALLEKRFKGKAFLDLCERVIAVYETKQGYGLPIGSLTSQWFANYYLDAFDRLLLNHSSVCDYVRYMDDMLICTHSKAEAKQLLALAQTWLHDHRELKMKPTWQLNCSSYGVTFCGFRVRPSGLYLSVRRRYRYQTRRFFWERAYQEGHITAQELQQAMMAVQSILQGTTPAWNKKNLDIHPAIEV